MAGNSGKARLLHNILAEFSIKELIIAVSAQAMIRCMDDPVVDKLARMAEEYTEPGGKS